MKRPLHSAQYFLLSILILVFAALACSTLTPEISTVEDSIQQTLESLKHTQSAMEQTPLGEPTEAVIETETQTEPSSAPPAKTTEAPDVIYEGISFSYDANIADSVNPAIIQGQNLGEDFMPGETYPTHFDFTFNGYAVRDHFHTPRILIFPVEDYRAISASATEQIERLQNALIDRPGGSSMSKLPFLPIWNAAQIFSAQVSYFDFQNGSGVRYLTMYGQGLSPVDNQNLFYTFQGMTDDQQYYLSAVLPVTHPELPEDGSSEVGDWIAFEQNWELYIIETMRFLGEQAEGSYQPRLDQLDAMMRSFNIAP